VGRTAGTEATHSEKKVPWKGREGSENKHAHALGTHHGLPHDLPFLFKSFSVSLRVFSWALAFCEKERRPEKHAHREGGTW